ncbi:hypothetical protein AFCDBAGC_4711 [Methylobacterium cerastii]|uniref:Uncharacterized protein n=1 Tax=Methylobacterium cerastii TaxID=932741 RepID=A0ABQ4QP29_9HYPH|nr:MULTISPECIES: hypothetical protein [Methylobacterium]TXN82616.1 hypothetical protein FV234_09485 [Methylobacterium sp. WL8]GJD46826.1 hypothetical protein AFCDBAGC_4711 [Methylobacterium cerastii]
MTSASNLRARLAASLLALACVVATPAAAREAARRPERPRPVQTVEPPPPSEPTGAWTSGTAPADCTRARRKLWQPEQGWIVKTITTCH